MNAAVTLTIKDREHLLALAMWKTISEEGPKDCVNRDEKKTQVGEVAKW